MDWEVFSDANGVTLYYNRRTRHTQYTMPLILQDDQEVPTEDITVLSSPHGRLRRSERRIDKQDLQAAVKYGLKIESGADRKTGRPRWRYEYGDIVYITDEFSRKEITSWQQVCASLRPISLSSSASSPSHQACTLRLASRHTQT
mmetsp:Transcript_6557/g.15891  ORF Transcript_6557/g.15891 Transcript_6557/m.15891 type:complete len:145 (-) Transcript_6557:2036-2470(-)